MGNNNGNSLLNVCIYTDSYWQFGLLYLVWLPRCLDGLVAMKEILKKTPNAKVLFVSAEKRVEKEALEAGAIGFFTKPTSIRNLLSEIHRIQELQTEKLKLNSVNS